ncbi:unnamed protein product [Paramecium primaurelia]|uniref:Phosphodiesterase n=1 Tax=Paramecium primaurelia TaxID=5886 RepID=A0A8S1QKE3_PARPR|nr:unnamed protein product [Paramecium primaurelia]
MQICQTLRSCINFHKLVQELCDQGEINFKEKNRLKQEFNSNNEELLYLIEDMDNQNFRQHLIDYVKAKHQVLKIANSPGIRRKSLLSESSPLIGRRSVFSKESKVTEEELLNYIKQLREALVEVYQSRSNALTLLVQDNLKSLTQFISKLPTKSPQPSLILLQETNIADDIECYYKQLKNQFLNTHSLLINDNIVSVTSNLVNNLLNCDEFTFINPQHGIYESVKHTFQIFNHDEYLEDLISITTNINLLTENQSKLFEMFSQYGRTYTLRVQDEFFFYHQKIQKDSLLNLTLEYNCFQEILMLTKLISKSIIESRVQQFSPIQIGNMILDVGVEFVRCSKYLFINQIINLLRTKYNIEKAESEIQGSYTSIQSTNPSPSNKQVKFAKIQFKDALPIEITVIGLNLNKKEDLQIYKTIQNLYNKYLKFIELTYDRITFYKYFIKSKDSIMLEFDKEGKLAFLSRPIPPSLSREFQLHYIHRGHYYQIIQNEKLLHEIEQHLENQWIIQQNEQLYEIFLKARNKKFKGFAIIFSEGFLQTRSLELEAKKIKLRQEATQYLTNLEYNNPEIKNTIMSFYMPSSIQAPKVLIKRKKSRMNGFIETVQINLMDPQSLEIEPIYMNHIDSFEFNIFKIENNSIEKQRMVYQIFQRNNFIEIFDIDKNRMCEFLSELEYRYDKRRNPFHNYNHGVNVMHSCHVIMNKMLSLQQYQDIFDNITKLALILGGLCHDVGHTGRTNYFEINNLSEKAIRYHDKNVLEQYHAATALKLLLRERMNFLKNIDFRSFREKFIQNIIFTDKAEHFNLLKFFEANNEKDIKIITGMIIHTSDFTGGSAKWPISKEWSLRVNQEFQSQYEEEGRLGLPQQSFMKDLHKMSVLSKSEIGFYKFIVRPLYVSLSNFMDNQLQDRVDNIDETIIEWDLLSSQDNQQQC